MSKKLTPKQAKFVEEYIKNGGNGTKAALKAYDTDDYQTAASIGEENLKKPEIRTLTEHLFSLEKTQQVVDNLHSLAINAEDQKIQVEATKTWLDKAIPKEQGGININFNQIVKDQRERYGD